jgi:hypothetical protein
VGNGKRSKVKSGKWQEEQSEELGVKSGKWQEEQSEELGVRS